MWRWCARLKFSVILLFLITPNVIGDDDSHDVQPLRICGSAAQETPSSRLVFISTLDGKLTALDILNNGEKKWALDFDDVPLVSSSIHKRELNEDGHWVKLIPSLTGGLYKFNGDTVEQIPVSTDQLLQSSFRYSDNLVFSGGKEIQTYGVVSDSGKILYHCTTTGCNNNTDGDTLHADVLIIQRLQQTIRAIEPSTGSEKWNYSVGTHQLNLVPTDKPCSKHPLGHQTEDNLELKVVIPQGLIWAVDKSNPGEVIWRHQFDTPIVAVWQQTLASAPEGNSYDSVKELNLFDTKQWSWGQDYPRNPAIYIGMHERQVYVQESSVKKFFALTDFANNHEDSNSPRNSPGNHKNTVFPWRPFPAHEKAVLRVETQEKNSEISSVDKADDKTAVGMSILYNSGYIDGNGYYLFQEQSGNCNETKSQNPVPGFHGSEPRPGESAGEESPLETIIESLWVWWKEIILLVIGTVVLNLIAQQIITWKFDNWRWGRTLPIIIEKYSDPVTPKRESVSEISEVGSLQFESPYMTKFQTIGCLGKGGYGVVFEAKNKIDDCHYAIKRISLPDSPSSRSRVLREVKALAKLDHQNIVRYFHAWFEQPPVGWQERHDSSIKMSGSGFASEDSEDPGTSFRDSDSVCIDVPVNGLDLSLQTDDSFVVFAENKSVPAEEPEEHDGSRWNRAGSGSNSIVFEIGGDSGGKSPRKSEESYDQESEIDETDGRKQKEVEPKEKSAKILFYIQMQLCRRSSLQDWLVDPENATRDHGKVIRIFQQIVDAVEYVHLKGLIHRDLKPSNILFADDNRVKIGDFGLVTAMAEEEPVGTEAEDYGGDSDSDSGEELGVRMRKHTANVGTQLYMSPEQMTGDVYDFKVDIYSLGIILFELLVPFSTGMERILVLGNLRKNLFPEDFAEKHPREYDLLTMMLDKDPRKRPTATGIKERPPFVQTTVK